MSLAPSVPDVSKEKLKMGLPIDLVGIQDIKMPVQLTSQIKVPACISIFVSLEDKNTRGIHMSRLYLILHEYFSKSLVSFSGLKKVLTQSIKGQKGISKSGRIRLKADWPVLKKALKSSIEGWREYPFQLEINYSHKENSWTYIAKAEALYSSTCPCSASLSREIIKKGFAESFAEKKNFTKKEIMEWLNDKKFLKATPHAQKSTVFFKVRLSEKSKNTFSILKTIEELEKQLGTPVQTAVKREDEAEFARLNAENLMFCEDAVRKSALLFKNKKNILDYFIRVQHYESLHPFTVESSIVKGVKGGWRA